MMLSLPLSAAIGWEVSNLVEGFPRSQPRSAMDVGDLKRGNSPFQSNLDSLARHIDTAHISHRLPLRLGFLLHLLHIVVELAQLRYELLAALGTLQRLGDERLDGEARGVLDAKTANPAEDGEFPGDIETVEVIAGVGLLYEYSVSSFDLWRKTASSKGDQTV